VLLGPRHRQRWNDFVAGHPEGHLLQSYEWGEFKRLHDWPSLRVIITEPGSERILAGAQVLFRHMAGLSIAYIPKGPVVDWDNRPLVDALFSTVRRFSRRRRAIYLKIEPNRPDNSTFEHFLTTDLGFKTSSETVQPRSTIRVGLSADPDAIMERMKPKTRYNIRLAERRGVTCRIANSADFESFYRLMEVTGQRDSFGIHSDSYYRDVLQTFQNTPDGCGKGALWVAEFEGKIVAGVMVFAFGKEAAYLYGASSDEHRREMPTYFLQWKAMLWAKAQGATSYDFWGIPDNVSEGQPDHEDSDNKNVRDGLWGVYRFKQGFGGEIFRYSGAFDMVYNRPMYLIWQRMQRRRGLS